MSIKRVKVKGHYREIIRDEKGRIVSSKKWSPNPKLTPEQEEALRELITLFTKLSMNDILWDKNNNPIRTKTIICAEGKENEEP